MNAKYIVIALLAACRNDAITLAHTIDPAAECIAKQTYSQTDTAMCRIGNRSVYCIVGAGLAVCIDGDRVVHSTYSEPEAK